MNETNQLSNYFEWSCSIDSVKTMDDLICLMYRNVSYHTSVVEIKKTNWWAVAILRLESNRWWIYSAFQPSILPLQTIQSHDSNSADSRFAIHVRPTTVFFHRSTNDTQFPRSSFFLFSFFFPPRRWVESESSFVPSKKRFLSVALLFSFNVSHDRVYTGNLWREYRDFAVDNRRSVISAAISRVVRPRGRNAPYDSLLIPVPLRLSSKIDRRSYRRIVARLIMLLSFRFEVWMLRVHRWTGNVFAYFY